MKSKLKALLICFSAIGCSLPAVAQQKFSLTTNWYAQARIGNSNTLFLASVRPNSAPDSVGR